MSVIIQGNTLIKSKITIGSPLILDNFSGSSAAFSLRKLSSIYTASAIRVRRSSDNSEIDIGFINNQLNTGLLLNYVGANIGYVTKLYDQSGNNRDLLQTTSTYQPSIVINGVLNKSNNKEAIRFDGANDYLSNNISIFSGSNPRTIISIYQPLNSTGSFTYSITGQSGQSSNGTWSMIQSRTLYVTGDPYFAGYSADLGSGLSSPNTNIKLGSFYYNGNIGYLYKNTSLITSGVLTFISPSTPYISAGVSFPITPNNEYLNGYITEILMYSSDQSQNRLAIEKNVNSYYSIY